MKQLIEKLLPSFLKPVTYERARAIAQSGSEGSRLALAKNPRTSQEILYYLAEHDSSPKVRRAVARNAATPVHASVILAGDRDEDVRMTLARRLIDLLPGLSEDKQSQLYAYVVQALGALALDEVLKVRKALASTLKDHAHTPPKIAAQLARDVEREVAEPILRFCAALADDDMLDILKQHPAGWTIEAIAGRHTVSEAVSQAVVDTGHAPAGAILLGNQGAQLSSALLETIVVRAREYPEWHEPLAMRKSLPPEMAKMLAEFVDDRIKTLLEKRGDFDEVTVQEIARVVRRRINYEEQSAGQGGAESPGRRASRLMREGKLDETVLSDALGMRDKEFVECGLAALARTDPDKVHKVFAMRAARPVCALAWKAGLSMRLALRLQQEMGQVPPKELLYPKGGTDYPLTRDELQWQLDFLEL